MWMGRGFGDTLCGLQANYTTLSAAPLELYQSQAANRYGTWHDECISKDQYVFLSLPQLACSLSLIRDVQASSPAPTLLWFSVGLESSVTRGQLETHPLPEPSPSSPALHSPAQWLHNTRGLRHTMQHRCNSYHQSIHVPLLINQCTSVLWQDLTPTVTPTDCALLGVLGNVISRTDKTDAQETWDVLSSAMPMSEPHDCSRPKMSQTVTNYTSTQNASWFPKDVYTLLWNINTLTPPPQPHNHIYHSAIVLKNKSPQTNFNVRGYVAVINPWGSGSSVGSWRINKSKYPPHTPPQECMNIKKHSGDPTISLDEIH